MSAISGTNLNYVDYETSFFFKNELTMKEENFYVEDWRQSWQKTGALVGDKLPVIRVSDPKNGRFYLVRPYYLKLPNGNHLTDRSGEKVVCFISPLFKAEYIKPKINNVLCDLDLIYKKPLCSEEKPRKFEVFREKNQLFIQTDQNYLSKTKDGSLEWSA